LRGDQLQKRVQEYDRRGVYMLSVSDISIISTISDISVVSSLPDIIF